MKRRKFDIRVETLSVDTFEIEPVPALGAASGTGRITRVNSCMAGCDPSLELPPCTSFSQIV